MSPTERNVFLDVFCVPSTHTKLPRDESVHDKLNPPSLLRQLVRETSVLWREKQLVGLFHVARIYCRLCSSSSRAQIELYPQPDIIQNT